MQEGVKMKNIAICIVLTLIFFTGCSTGGNMETNRQPSQLANAKSGDDQAVLTEYNDLIFGKDADTQAIISFIQNNANVVSSETASEMILRFEEFQKNKLPTFEEKFNTGLVQKELMEQYLAGADINNPDNIQQSEIKALVTETKNSGYKIIQTDGICYPIIDYAFYQTFGENMTPEVSEYIGIFTVESDRPPLRNAGLEISWEELISRAVRQERFITDFNGSKTAEKVNTLYQTYVQLIFFGADNTSLFDADTGVLKSDVKAAFEHAASSNQESALTKEIISFLDLLKKSDYRYTEEVEQFRERIDA